MKKFYKLLNEIRKKDKQELTKLIRKFNNLEGEFENVQDNIMDIFTIENEKKFRELQNIAGNITSSIVKFRKVAVK